MLSSIISVIYCADWCTVINADYNDDALLHYAE